MEDIRITEVPLGGSREAIAFELWKQLRQSHGAASSLEAELELFKQCLAVTDRKPFDIGKVERDDVPTHELHQTTPVRLAVPLP